jgi:hypothetical protein
MLPGLTTPSLLLHRAGRGAAAVLLPREEAHPEAAAAGAAVAVEVLVVVLDRAPYLLMY